MKIIIAIACLLFSLSAFTQDKQKTSEIYIDKKGVMRWDDNNREASFYGVNYTVPFAHAYRALGYLNKDRKEAIDKDVYHFSRLGFNAYRIHIWDVEISDGKGQMIKNDHLDLLDYLIAKLRERNIRVLITTMTNFGNGYPERNQNNGAFSYLYDKCKIHSDANAIAAQKNYVSQLVTHVNPYTKLSYKDDPFVIGFEINNEPCHSDTPTQTESYINTMLDAIKKAGNKKPVFYNVSHNMDHVQAYFNTAIQGTTYQWYPIGLVAGHTRKGNFLPFVDSYNIPFANAKGFENKAKAIYEYDPADITYSYMYPAMTRTFRSQGFQWITQFAYDPIDMAWANTEYQTHFLNLAYTPAKAVSMAIAAEVAYTVPLNRKYEKYPNDTIFDNFHVSYNTDLSELNSPDKFFYSNNTTSDPSDINSLEKIIGHGSSPIVKYEGTGAYFLDQLESGVWRLEVMPDAIQINDPFAKPSLKKEVVTIAWNTWNMEISIPGLGENFTVTAINKGNVHNETSSGKSISVRPGVYLLTKSDYTPTKDWQAKTAWGNITLGEFVAPEAHAKTFSVVHSPAVAIEEGKPLQIEAQIVGAEMPDSVIIYTDKVSFWNDKNTYYKMNRTHSYTYRVTIPAEDIKEGKLKYNIIVCSNDKNYTFPSGMAGNPLDWDYTQAVYWESHATNAASPVSLFTVTDAYSDLETYIMPEWSRTDRKVINNNPAESPTLRITFESDAPSPRFFLRKYVKDVIAGRMSRLAQGKEICLHIKNAPEKLSIGFITGKGFTYTAIVNSKQGIQRIPLSALRQTHTALLPHPYPVFLDKYFEPDTQIPFSKADIESLEISFDGEKGKKAEIEIGNIWIE
ncbi:hypothetical protein M2451_003705 [Dysgonomonas sp. PFB1-18]|uniref:cellulase family glycosylhydrolase n=1 Tax=unclassified Dysgonomonas TaxID=2630389 RepID=UPI0024730AC1|nr:MULTISPECIES: cellulase family glycosylhydrolase [unclassified Dysgonomonas]MDH6310433.1 hypothetical protein [Dysgonomonas sp. PF1-14]MDH6340744.1 hypothetical protein [Dysgonomonas sp. PF1-16]MDH6382364.1 hypothetical protein [Dysgonomonas sp. PFB1-18]MDH6399735.1 hypothetical protein [Dysgonomonas sp. PF1-23]